MLLTFISSCNENEVENEKKKNGKNINESWVILRQYSAAAAAAAGAYMLGGEQAGR